MTFEHLWGSQGISMLSLMIIVICVHLLIIVPVLGNSPSLEIRMLPSNQVHVGSDVQVSCLVRNVNLDSVRFKVRLECPLAGNYCFEECVDICKNVPDCPNKRRLDEVYCSRNIENQMGDISDLKNINVNYIFNNVSTLLGKKGFQCKFMNIMSTVRFLNILPATKSSKPVTRLHKVTTQSPGIRTSSSYNKASNGKKPISHRTQSSSDKSQKENDDIIFLHYLILVVVIVMIGSFLISVFCCIRCIIVEKYSKNQKQVPLRQLCCLDTEVALRRRNKGFPVLPMQHDDDDDTPPYYATHERHPLANGTTPEEIYLSSLTRRPQPPPPGQREPIYQMANQMYNPAMTSIPSTPDAIYQQHGGPYINSAVSASPSLYLAANGHMSPRLFRGMPQYNQYNQPSATGDQSPYAAYGPPYYYNQSSYPDGTVSSMSPLMGRRVSPGSPPVGYPYMDQFGGQHPLYQQQRSVVPMLPEEATTCWSQSNPNMSDTTSFAEDPNNCLPSIPGYVSRTASARLYDSRPKLFERRDRVSSDDALDYIMPPEDENQQS